MSLTLEQAEKLSEAAKAEKLNLTLGKVKSKIRFALLELRKMF